MAKATKPRSAEIATGEANAPEAARSGSSVDRGKANAGAQSEPAGFRTRLKMRLLQIAEQLLEDEGLAGLQARRLAKEADCSVGTIYNIFNGLDGLIVAANTQTLRAFGRSAELAIRRARDGTFEDKLMALAFAYLDFAIQHRKRLQAVFDFQMPERDGAAAYDDEQARLFALVERSIEDHVPDAVERARVARSMFAAVHGIVVIAIDNKLGSFDSAETEKRVRFIVQAMARGLPKTDIGAA